MVSSVKDILFDNPSESIFTILDGASVKGLLDRLYPSQLNYFCLYRGKLKNDIAHIAPYLVQLEQQHSFTEWLINKGWGRHWGIYIKSRASLRTLRRHFRSFLMVEGRNQNPVYFRYYDPRVFSSYIESCLPDERREIFGPVKCYILEGKANQFALTYSNNGENLNMNRIVING